MDGGGKGGGATEIDIVCGGWVVMGCDGVVMNEDEGNLNLMERRTDPSWSDQYY